MTLFSRNRFAFENYGGAYQLRIRSAEDLAALDQLDEPFWMATSAPAGQFSCDGALLARLDSDGDGRIRSRDVRRATAWLLRVLRNRRGVYERSDCLTLSALDTTWPEGAILLDAARRILHNLGAGDAELLTLAQVRDRQAIFSRGCHNGDGIIPPGSVEDDDLRGFVEDILATVGSVEDVSGAAGINHELLNSFVHRARALLEWQREREADSAVTAMFPLGDDTPAGYELLQNLGPRVDSYFDQCRLASLNTLLGRGAEPAICPRDVMEDDTLATAYMEHAPLALPSADRALPLTGAVNPRFERELKKLAETVVRPLLGADFAGETLTEDQWVRVKDSFAVYGEWYESKQDSQVETLGPARLEAYLTGDLPERLGTMIEADLAAGTELNALNDLEYLILLQRWLIDLCNNFVSFRHLYEPGRRAMFEAGRLVMDGRIFNVNFKVDDPAIHAPIAERSGIYLLYSRVTAGPDDQPFFIVTPVSSGRLGDLWVGRRGVLFDQSGKVWDTVVVKVVENPVSVWEAVAAPFKRIGAMISSTAERVTSTTQQQIETSIGRTTESFETGLRQTMDASATVPAPTQPPAASGSGGLGGLRDLVLSVSVAVAALGSSFAYIAKTMFVEPNWAFFAMAIAIGLGIIIVPTVLLAVTRLRAQNLSPVLEASGWAINAPMRLTRDMRRIIVQRPTHPESFLMVPRDLLRAFADAIRNAAGEPGEPDGD